MDTCGIQLNEIDHYLHELKIRSLADSDSVPPIYPRTLVSAVSLCLERLHARISDDKVGNHAHLALKMIINAAFLASRQLPCHMIAAPVMFDPSPETGLGIWLLAPSIANMGEVVRELRRFSLIGFDQDLPGMGDPIIDENRTITANTIVQEIIRVEIERNNDTGGTLNRLANHVERWLVTALELNHLERASALFPHAEMLANHMRRLGVVGRHAALLYGNLAGAYRARGDISKVEEFLYSELEIAQSNDDPDDILVVQAKLALVDLYFDNLAVTSISFDEVTSYLEDVAQSAANISRDYPEAAVKVIIDAKSFLDRPEARVSDSPRLAIIESKFDELASQLGPTEYSDAMLAIRKASKLISKGRLGTAERLCTRALGSGSITGIAELEARRFLVESLVLQGKWQEAEKAHIEFRHHFGSTNLLVPVVISYAHNIGYACSILILAGGTTEAIPILSDLVGWPVVSAVIEHPSTGSESRLRLLLVIYDVVHGHYDAAQEGLRSVLPADLREGTQEEVKGWCVLWQLTCLAAFRGTSQAYMASVRPRR